MTKKYHKNLYRLLFYINNVFIKHNIQYWAVAGTLLGAIRHKGNIQWDDDADLAVWKRDYKKILSKEVVKDFKKYNITAKYIKEDDGSDLLKIFPTNGEDLDRDYRFPFVDIFPARYNKKEKKIEYAFAWARKACPKEYFRLEELYPLKYLKYGNFTPSEI